MLCIKFPPQQKFCLQLKRVSRCINYKIHQKSEHTEMMCPLRPCAASAHSKTALSWGYPTPVCLRVVQTEPVTKWSDKVSVTLILSRLIRLWVFFFCFSNHKFKHRASTWQKSPIHFVQLWWEDIQPWTPFIKSLITELISSFSSWRQQKMNVSLYSTNQVQCQPWRCQLHWELTVQPFHQSQHFLPNGTIKWYQEIQVVISYI